MSWRNHLFACNSGTYTMFNEIQVGTPPFDFFCNPGLNKTFGLLTNKDCRLGQGVDKVGETLTCLCWTGPANPSRTLLCKLILQCDDNTVSFSLFFNVM
jgi:hypothetical protein